MAKPVIEKLVATLFQPADKKQALNPKVSINEFQSAQLDAQAFRHEIKEVNRLFREYSAFAVHEFDISKKTIVELLTNVLTKAKLINSNTTTGLKVQSKFPNLVNDLADNIIARLIKEVTTNKNRKIPMIVSADKTKIIIGEKGGNTNNFNAISDIFVKAAGTKSDSHNIAFRKLIYDFIGEVTDEVDSKGRAIYKDKALELEVRKAFTRNSPDIDKGHAEISSNIQQALGSMIFNAIHTESVLNLPVGSEARQLAAEELKILEDAFRGVINKPAFKRHLKDYFSNNKKLATMAIAATIGFARQLANGEINVIVNETSELNNSVIAQIAKEITVHIFPQDASLNSKDGATIEKMVADHFRKDQYNIGQLLHLYLKGAIELPGIPPITELPGSPSIKDLAERELFLQLSTGKGLSASNKFNTTAKSKRVSTSVSLPKNNVKGSGAKPLPKLNVPVINQFRPRSSDGKFVSLVNIVNLINLQLADKIRQNMGSPRLNYRTGRFSQSAQVLPASVDKDGAIRLPYTYLKSPYQTFEVGFSRGSAARDPRVVISESIRELAVRQVAAKLRIVRV